MCGLALRNDLFWSSQCNPELRLRVPRPYKYNKPMEKVKAGLRGLTADDKLIRGRIVYKHMNGNPHFPNPEPSMPEMLVACDELQAANLAALDRGRLACARKAAAVARMDSYLTRLAGYANSAALGDVEKLITSGFELVKEGKPRSEVAMPYMHARRVFMSGSLEIGWTSIQGALVYELERTNDPFAEEPRWERVLITSRPWHVMKGLVPNTWHAFRVKAIGARAEGPFSPVLQVKSAA